MGKGGRPPKWKSVEAMQEAIDKYFESCKGEPLMIDGEPFMDKLGNVVLIHQHPPTVTGLALALGFTSRLALLNYEARPEFFNAVTRAKARCEEYAEERLFDKDGQRGAAFSLRCNFRWSEDGSGKEDGSGDSNSGVVELPAVMDAPEPPEYGGAGSGGENG